MQLLKSLSGRGFLEGQTVARIKLPGYASFTRGSDCYEDCADGFFRRTTPGTGYARDGYGVVASTGVTRAFGHFTSDGFAHGAMPFKDLRADAQELLFRFVAVSHEAAGENC